MKTAILSNSLPPVLILIVGIFTILIPLNNRKNIWNIAKSGNYKATAFISLILIAIASTFWQSITKYSSELNKESQIDSLLNNVGHIKTTSIEISLKNDDLAKKLEMITKALNDQGLHYNEQKGKIVNITGDVVQNMGNFDQGIQSVIAERNNLNSNIKTDKNTTPEDNSGGRKNNVNVAGNTKFNAQDAAVVVQGHVVENVQLTNNKKFGHLPPGSNSFLVGGSSDHVSDIVVKNDTSVGSAIPFGGVEVFLSKKAVKISAHGTFDEGELMELLEEARSLYIKKAKVIDLIFCDTPYSKKIEQNISTMLKSKGYIVNGCYFSNDIKDDIVRHNIHIQGNQKGLHICIGRPSETK